MNRAYVLVATAALAATVAFAFAADAPAPKPADKNADLYNGKFFKSDETITKGAVLAGGSHIAYQAIAGTLVVHQKDWDDAAQSGGDKNPAAKEDSSSAEASMFFVYYAKRDAKAEERPITFLFNGGPGSSTVWLHMGAFGPKRVVTADDTHTPAAPYKLIDNDESLLDASDLVFIDAPGTGFSRISGPDKEKSFYGVDQDAHAFARFVTGFLSKYQRWNSPKYLFGESYGTMRAAVLVNLLQTDPGVDFNGVIMLSQVLAANLYPDQPKTSPGNDLPYQLG